MANEIAIPALPTVSMNDTLALYQALGFKITYQQRAPNVYCVVQREDLILHFFTLKGLQAGDSYATCIVLTLDADGLYQAFAAGLRAHYGKLPISGFPRMTPIRNKAGNTRGFNLVDNTGNWIRFVQQLTAQPANPEVDASPDHAESISSLARAYAAAETLAESRGDYALAAKTLDKALAKADAAPPSVHACALILRGVLAYGLGDTQQARALLDQARAIPLTEDDRAELADDFQRAAELEESLSS